MLDPKIIRDEPEKIRKMLIDRAIEFDFDGMLELDKKRRELIKETDELRKKTKSNVNCNWSGKKIKRRYFITSK